MQESLIHANCGGEVTKEAETEIYKCGKCEEAGIAVQHTDLGAEKGEVIILKQSTEQEIEKIEEEADDQI
ncbi:MAG: hypothetical protein ABIU20_02180 [Blastocatellia bacterium]